MRFGGILGSVETCNDVIRDGLAQDRDLLVETLMSAFAKDPFLTWFMRPGAGAQSALREFFIFMLASEPLEAQWVDILGEGKAIAVWVRPGGTILAHMLKEQIQGALAAMRFSGISRLARAAMAGRIVDRCRCDLERLAGTNKVAYLRFLACRDDAKGQSLGARVLQYGLERCNRAGVDAYLETGRQSTIDLYSDHGFTSETQYPYGKTGSMTGMLYRHAAR